MEIDRDRIANNLADPAARQARIEESLAFEQSLPSEEGKAMIGEIH